MDKQKPALVIMAAGMGSRFGGLKQIEPVDPEGHIIIDFSLFDAWRAGFRDVVFIIKREMEAEFRERIGNRMEQYFHVSYVFQEMDRLPDGTWVQTVDGLRDGALYKYAVTGADGQTVLKADPFAAHCETGPATASKVWAIEGYVWHDRSYLRRRAARDAAAPRGTKRRRRWRMRIPTHRPTATILNL